MAAASACVARHPNCSMKKVAIYSLFYAEISASREPREIAPKIIAGEWGPPASILFLLGCSFDWFM
jgi:hypothetical protein